MIIKPVKVLIATIGLCLGSAAIAEDLVRYGLTASGTVFYYDADTIRQYSNNTVEVWQKEDASKDKTVSHRIARNKLRMNCSDETFGFVSINNYRADGTVMESSDYEFPKMSSVVPTSTIDTLFKILCPR